jgi:hypothetical protein
MDNVDQWFPKWAVLPPGGRWDYLGVHYEARGMQETLKVGSSEHIVCLFTTEVTLDQTPGNWYHFIKLIHLIKNLLTVK